MQKTISDLLSHIVALGVGGVYPPGQIDPVPDFHPAARRDLTDSLKPAQHRLLQHVAFARDVCVAEEKRRNTGGIDCEVDNKKVGDGWPKHCSQLLYRPWEAGRETNGRSTGHGEEVERVHPMVCEMLSGVGEEKKRRCQDVC